MKQFNNFAKQNKTMNEVATVKNNTGFPASMNNFPTTTNDFNFFEGTSDKLSAMEIIKNEFFIIQEAIPQEEVSVQSLFKSY